MQPLTYPVSFSVDYPDRPLDRLTTLFRIFVAIPIVIVLGSDGTGDREHFRSVEVAGHTGHPYSRRDEHFDIFLCRGFTGDLRQAWAKMKKYD